MLRATLPAPPSELLSRSTRTTGTGASGETLVTLPQMNRSTMRSPITRSRAPENRAVISPTRARLSCGAGPSWVLRAALRFDGGLFDQHDRDVVDDLVPSSAGAATEPLAVGSQVDAGLTGGAGKDFEQLSIDRHASSVEACEL